MQHFERAYALSQHPVLLFNIARAADGDGQITPAIRAYTGYLEAFPNADNREFAEGRLAKLRALEAAATTPAPATDDSTAAAAVALPSVAESTPMPAPLAVSTSGLQHDETPRGRPFWKRGWFWTVVGVAVAGAATTGVLLARRSDDGQTDADLHISALNTR